jgi:alpha-beta hydrolase superfamily lysophospholipase
MHFWSRCTRYIAIILSTLSGLNSFAQYRADELGNNFVCKTISMPDDYEGKVICTLIKRSSNQKSNKAVLYVHGFNDYFFQTEIADRFEEMGYNLYAVDLRKYGRSLMPHQKRCNTRAIEEYFADLDTTVNIIKSEGYDKIILLGHSTGGLITSLYCHSKGDRCPVDGLILNSPFFKINTSGFLNKIVIPFIAAVAEILPTIDIPQSKTTGYAESLLKEYRGEWKFDTTKKLMLSPDVTTDWIAAIYTAHKQVRRGLNIRIPVLAMCSDKSVEGSKWSPEFMRADAVLNVADNEKYFQSLGSNVQSIKIVDGMHDLFCSQPEVRESVYRHIYNWLRKTEPAF